MPRFQSRLFNWIDTSLPAQIGRSVRRSLDQKIRQLAGLPIQELPRLLAYQAAKAALYPIYLLTSTTKRIFPALDRSKIDPKEKLRSQPEATGLLPKSASQELDQTTDQKVEPTNDLPKPEIPLFFRPLAKFLDWIDRTKAQLDRKIFAIVKRQPENLSTTKASELEPKLIANRLFAEIWRQQIDQAQAEQNSLKENNGLSENVALGKNKRLEQLRRLIEAAIAYFFGNQEQTQDQSIESNQVDAEIFGTESPEVLSDSPKLRRRRVTAAKSGKLKENAPLAEINNLDRLRDLIAAAIDYFIGKRSLDGDLDGNPAANADGISGTQSDLLTEKIIDKIQSRVSSYPNRAPNPELEFDDALKLDNQLERLQKLIEDAIAYFFGKQRSQPTLDETSDITPSAEAWLTMEDLFGDDNGPWPLPLEYESIAFSKSPDRTAIHSSSELQNFETTTTQISQDQLEGSLVFEEELLMYQSQSSDSDSDRPLRAWIETKANLWGYANNPVMRLLIWIDAIVVKIENLIIKLWKGLINFPKRLINFIRYGKFR
ncbi:hypothetical protein [Pseudanabaena sp. lw0831]|uniref:hypothetical protein n=1 Tax=Pseudanabaena sp. lw0831 TaxID=1357935 RepID=UPI0019160E51|nr:hypothetical protein [Pseudanabaena sp. lw0831]